MKQKILLMLALWLSLVGSTWAQSTSIAVTITKTDASVINSSGASLQDALEATTLGEVKKLEINAGSITYIDWQWLSSRQYSFPSLTHFSITDGVSEVSSNRNSFDRIFYSYGSLEQVDLNCLTEIRNSDFRNFTNLKSANFPVATIIGSRAFEGCIALNSVSIPQATQIGATAFSGCSILSSVSFPLATSIEGQTFVDCIALNSVSIPKATKVGGYAFMRCNSLEAVSFPLATTIETGAFESCRTLKSINIPKATSLDFYAFNDCPALGSLSIPMAASINAYAFQHCLSLRNLLLGPVPPSGITNTTFYNCPATRYLAFADADGNLLTGVELENARAAYKAVDDGNTSDNLWHGWDISRNLYVPSIDPAIVNGSLTAGNPDAELFGGYPAGATIFITSSPATSYRLKPGSLRVYKTGDETVEVPLTGNSFTMPDFEVTVTAEFEPLPLQVTFVAENAGNIPIGLLLESGSGRIVVDKGDGVLVPYDIDSETSSFYITSYVAGNTVKIYSDNITELAFQCILTALDVSRVATLTQLSCPNSRLNFATLPQPKSSYTEYEYIPQQNLAATCTNGVVDLSSQLTAIDKDGNTQTTEYKWFLANETELTNNFIPENGVFRFVLDPGTVVYCTMTNAAFPGLTLRSTDITVDAKVNPNIALVSENTGNLSFYVQWDGAGENIAYVDWGNGVLLSYTDNTISTSTYVAGNTVKIYGENINYFDASAQGLTALDLSNISTLTTLYCNTNKISSLDVSQNTGLTYISCYDNNLGSLDVSQNTVLTYLSCFDNNIISLNVDQNTALATFDCSDNDLTTLDVSQNTSLEELFCAGNQLNFATLPQVNSSYSDYSFFPQQNLVATCTNGVVDLSSQLRALGYVGTTTYTWYLSNNTLLSKKYMEEDGVFRFVAEPGTVVYCLMTNPAFPNLTLRTTNITIDAKATLPEPSFTFVSANTEGNLSFGADNGESTYIYIDWGNGELVRGLVDANVMIDNTTTSYIANNMVKVYARGDVYILYVDNQKVTALDVSKLTELDYLNCSNNRLTTLDVSNNPKLWALNCSYNKLEALDLSQNTLLEELNCSGNSIGSIQLSANTALTSLDVSYNRLSYKTLPQVKALYAANYNYSPQDNLAATCTNGVVNLSEQRTIADKDGVAQITEYTWRETSGDWLIKGVDYLEQNGVFSFLQQPETTVYCTMANAAFPGLVLNTMPITVDAVLKPSVTFVSNKNGDLSFKVTTATTPQQLLVDWGDGNLVSYEVNGSLTSISTSSYIIGSQVKVFGDGIRELILNKMGIELLDISNCPELRYFACYNNNISSIDVTQNTQLYYLDCGLNDISVLDVSNNTGLKILKCFGNTLQSLDLSKNTLLEVLSCYENSLTELDLSNNTLLSEIYCGGNKLSFATLPQNKSAYTAYGYAPQANLAATCTGGVVDLSSQLTATDVNEALQTTTYKWFLADGTELATNYMEGNGVFHFFVEPGTELYCEMTNAAFPALTLRTENIFIDTKATLPEPNITFVSEKNGSLSFIANNSQAGKVYVDWGDGVLTAYNVPVDGNQLSTSNYTANNTAKVYGANISQLYVFSAGLTALDVTKCTSLTRLDCFSNKLTSLDLTKNSALTSLSCSENMLTSIDLSHNTGLTHLNCKNNKLTALDVSSNTNLSNFFCFGNELTFNSLPQVKTNYDTYAYAPQANLAATCTNGLIDLSSQLTATDANGNTQNTAYAWYLADGTALTEDVDYKRSGGIFFFLKQPSSDVYCSMTNPAFPDLVLRTVDIAIDKVLEVNISFVSEKNGEMAFGAKPVEAGKTFVDWGDGELWTTDLVQPMTIFVNPDYVAGSLVKMYGANFQIFNIGSMELSSLDVSKATNLTYLVCNNNKLISLDVSKNTLLTGIECQNNRLSVLDLSHNSSWQSVYCNNNSFNFATLTQLKMFTTYKYSPQANLAASCINGVVDLSSQLTATDIYGAEKTTAYTWYTQSGTGLTAGIDYSEAAGVFTFNSELADSVFCVMSNLAFPELLLQTVNLKISFCTNPTAGGEISGDQAICFGETPSSIESTTLPTGETGTIEYKWQASTESSGAGFVDIESSNAETYAPGALNATTWYKRLTKVTCMSDWTGAVESNVVEVVVNTLPDAPTVPANQNTYVYDGLPKTLAGVVGLGESIFWYDAETGGNSITAPVATNVGTYSAWAETKNDATACTSATRSLLTLTIEKATLAVTAHKQTKVYGDSNPVLTFEYDGFVNNDGIADLDEEPVAVTTIDELSNAGLYVDLITFTGGYDNNYKFDFVPGDFEITKATLTVTAHKQTKVYGESNPVLTFEYDGFVNNDGINVLDEEPVAVTTIDELSNADYYTAAITFTGGDDNNYKFDFVSGDFEITKATLTVTAHKQTKVYGESNPVLTFEYDGFVNNDNASDLDDLPIISTTIDEFSGAGFYPDSIILKGGLDNNYELELVSGDFNIKKATLTVTADNKNRLYGRANPELTFSYSGFFAEEDASILDVQPEVSTLASKDSDVGSYEIIVSGGSDDNYDMLYRNGKLNIEQGNLNIFAEDKTVRYGDSIPELTLRYEFFDTVGTVSGLDHKITAWVNTDSITGPGTYPIHISGGKDNNYALFYFEGTLTIEKALLKVTAQDKSITYGETLPELTYTIEGFLEGDKDSVLTSLPTIAAATGAGENAGVFAIMPSGGSDEFYDFDYQNGKLMVAKAMLTATASDMVSSVGTIPQLTVGYAGFVKGDTSSELDTLPVATTTATKDSPSGEYPISVSGGYDNNYNFTYIGGELTLASKATPTITWNTPSDMVYGELLSEKQLNATCNAYGTFVYEPAAGTLLGAGDMKELKVTFEPFDTININKVSKIVYVDVQKAVLTVKANDKIVNYGDTLPVLSFSCSGFINDENAGVLDVLPTITSIDGVVEAGTYPIVVSGGADNNYIFEYENGTLTVKPRLNPVVIWENPSSITYGTELSQVQLNAKTDVAGTFVYTPSAGTVFEAGELQPIIVQFTPADTLTYAVVTDTAFVSVYKATLTVTANDVEMNAGETVPEFTLSYSGFVNGDDELDIDKLPVASSTVKSATIKSVYEITVSGGQDNNYGFVYKSGNLIVNSGVGVDAMKSVSMLVYPNPFTDQVSITSDYKGVGSYQLSDITGKVIEQGNIANGTGNLKLSHIRSGVYLLQVKLGEGNKTFRIVKQ